MSVFVTWMSVVCEWAACKNDGIQTRVYSSFVAAGAPEHIVKDVVKSFNIAKVVRGTISETTHYLDHDETRYEYPKQAGIFKYASLPGSTLLQCACGEFATWAYSHVSYFWLHAVDHGMHRI